MIAPALSASAIANGGDRPIAAPQTPPRLRHPTGSNRPDALPRVPDSVAALAASQWRPTQTQIAFVESCGGRCRV